MSKRVTTGKRSEKIAEKGRRGGEGGGGVGWEETGKASFFRPLLSSAIVPCLSRKKDMTTRKICQQFRVYKNIQNNFLISFPWSTMKLNPCSHPTLILINRSIIQAIILLSILFNYGSVHIRENSNTIGRVTSQGVTKWRRIAWLLAATIITTMHEREPRIAFKNRRQDQVFPP